MKNSKATLSSPSSTRTSLGLIVILNVYFPTSAFFISGSYLIAILSDFYWCLCNIFPQTSFFALYRDAFLRNFPILFRRFLCHSTHAMAMLSSGHEGSGVHRRFSLPLAAWKAVVKLIIQLPISQIPCKQ